LLDIVKEWRGLQWNVELNLHLILNLAAVREHAGLQPVKETSGCSRLPFPTPALHDRKTKFFANANLAEIL
jgi:hypothetical protein